ncbi:MAG: SET domain-containing protein-lysine N-methyltransferase, partial [Bacteroidota bacterium]
MSFSLQSSLTKNHPKRPKNQSQSTFHQCNTNEMIAIINIPKKGRGIIAKKEILKETLIEMAPSSSFPAKQWPLINETDVFKYCFVMPSEYKTKQEVNGYLVFGLSSLCNHSDTPNAYIEWVRDGISLWANLIALKDIQAEEEI